MLDISSWVWGWAELGKKESFNARVNVFVYQFCCYMLTNEHFSVVKKGEHFYTGANLAEHTFYKDFGGQYKLQSSLDNISFIIW